MLGVLAVAFDGGGEQRAVAGPRPDSVARIAGRVEHERGLRFERRPQPLTVSPQQARREGLASLDADYPPARRRADAAVLALLGLVPRGTDLRETAAETFGESVAGYYDPRSGRAPAGCGSSRVRRPP